jgi:hypothetical protein
MNLKSIIAIAGVALLGAVSGIAAERKSKPTVFPTPRLAFQRMMVVILSRRHATR